MESIAGTRGFTAPTPGELAEAAQAWGIETSYWDMWGHQHHASPGLVTAILASFGVDASTGESLAEAREKRAWREWHPPLAPTLVITASQTPAEIAISLSEAQAGGEVILDLRLEQGGAEQIRIAL